MTPTAINYEMGQLDQELNARLDAGKIVELPDYAHDLNATQRVLRGLDEAARTNAIVTLWTLVNNKRPTVGEAVALATPAQWCEAILRATGRWKEGE